ncbi:MAG: FtsH protease activity modulator HflK [Rhodobacteraceae bacterium]|nr:FtsH protease activity modulator HflK [Paracoccaceae bacterium]
MPYSNDGGPWGSGKKGGGNQGGGGKGPWGGGERGDRGGRGNGGPGGQPPVPDIDEIVRKGQEQLKILMGGRSGGSGRGPSGGSGGGGGGFSRIGILVVVGVLLIGWLAMSFYRVQDFERSVELTLGECRGDCVGGPGLNFAPWPIVTHVIIPAFREQTVEIGAGTVRGASAGLMLTGDENIVDINFEVVWNVRNPEEFLFNLSNPQSTIEAVAESAMREVVARSELAPILNRDRGVISQEVQDLIQSTLDEYGSGVNIVRLNFDKADPPAEVIDAFREVQAARQERSTLQNRADAYANERLAGARGQAAEIVQEAEGYRAREVNSAQGDASRFSAVLTEYLKAPDVTRERLYLETMEGVLGSVQMYLLDTPTGNAQGVVPYLPLNELRSGGAVPTTTSTGGAN